jgi:hypothetical protein
MRRTGIEDVKHAVAPLVEELRPLVEIAASLDTWEARAEQIADTWMTTSSQMIRTVPDLHERCQEASQNVSELARDVGTGMSQLEGRVTSLENIAKELDLALSEEVWACGDRFRDSADIAIEAIEIQLGVVFTHIARLTLRNDTFEITAPAPHTIIPLEPYRPRPIPTFPVTPPEVPVPRPELSVSQPEVSVLRPERSVSHPVARTSVPQRRRSVR